VEAALAMHRSLDHLFRGQPLDMYHLQKRTRGELHFILSCSPFYQVLEPSRLIVFDMKSFVDCRTTVSGNAVQNVGSGYSSVLQLRLSWEKEASSILATRIINQQGMFEILIVKGVVQSTVKSTRMLDLLVNSATFWKIEGNETRTIRKQSLQISILGTMLAASRFRLI
jgi:hypothetical protein